MFIFSVFDWKYTFFDKFGPKYQNCSFEVKFRIKTDLYMQNSIVILSFFALHQKYPFLEKSASNNQNC